MSRHRRSPFASAVLEAGLIERRGATAVTVPARRPTDGAVVQFASTLRVADTASIVSTAGHGISASNLSAVRIQSAANVVQGNGPGAVGIDCFTSAPMTGSAVALTGNPVECHRLRRPHRRLRRLPLRS